MIVWLVRLLGGILGYMVTRWIINRTVLHSGGGEWAIADGMWFIFGGWLVLLFYDIVGVAIGAWISVPAINLIGTWLQSVWHKPEE